MAGRRSKGTVVGVVRGERLVADALQVTDAFHHHSDQRPQLRNLLCLQFSPTVESPRMEQP